MKNKNILFLYTIDFPCDQTALEQYVKSELLCISSVYDVIYIFPTNYKLLDYKLPENVLVIDLAKYNTISTLSKIGAICTSFTETIIEGTKSKNKNYWADFKTKVLLFYSAIMMSILIEEFIKKNNFNKQHILHFSYWFSAWAITLSILKRKKYINNFYCRGHQADVYFDNSEMFHSRFQHFKVKYVSKVYAISNHARDYLKLNFKAHSIKFETAYLGIKNDFINPVSNTSDAFHIVSCSKISEHKRNHLVIEILNQIDFSIKWTHYGLFNNGYKKFNEFIDVIKQKNNVTVDLKGFQKNEFILNDYKNIPIDLFISTSELEGLSFAMIEALAFGIPMLATNINGTLEICNENTGLLLPLNFDINDATAYIKKLNENKPNTLLREKCLDYFNINFNYKNNFIAFHQNLIFNSKI